METKFLVQVPSQTEFGTERTRDYEVESGHELHGYTSYYPSDRLKLIRSSRKMGRSGLTGVNSKMVLL
jgi:hypothetical protein